MRKWRWRVKSGVPGLAREHAEINADLFQRLVVFVTDVGAEDKIQIRRAMQPAIALNFIFELAGSPTGIAERQNRARRPVAAGNRFENIERSGETDAVVDRQRRIFDKEIGRVQHETALGFDRSATHDFYDLC